MEKQVQKLFSILKKCDYTLASAESCTGGLLGGEITSVPGSSRYYAGGIIAYANRIKISRLGVDEKLLNEEGAVSKEVALAMARGATKAFKTDIALSTTGIAGPSGSTGEKPVGLVYTAVSSPAGAEVSENIFEGNRAEIRMKTVKTVLELAASFIST